jgi:hypothetical protein
VQTAVLLLLQLPPAVPLAVRVILEPAQTLERPVIAPAVAPVDTVTRCVVDTVAQLEVTVYVIVALPAATPFTTPVALLTVATDVLLLLQVPPLTVSASVIAALTQTLVRPVIVPVAGAEPTEMILNALAVPHEVVTE